MRTEIINGHKVHVVYETIHGSKMYGLATENSDVDYKGIFIPNMRQILLGNVPKSISYSNENEVVDKKDTVEGSYYSLRYFIYLAASGQTVAFDMLFGPESCVTYKDPVVNFLFENRTKFFTRKLGAIMGYAAGQAVKYSNKGTTLNALLDLQNHLKDEDPDGRVGRYGLESFVEKYPNLYSYRKMKNRDCQLFCIDNSEFSVETRLHVMLDALDKKIKKYGRRTKTAAEDDGADFKALSHALRCITVAKDIITKGTFSYPLDNTKLLFDIKLGKIDYDEVTKMIDLEYENTLEMIKNSPYPDMVDRTMFDDKVVEIYTNMIRQGDF